ncbi:MAG: ATP phosphoribosyltransferase [Porticoccaceae bacterium]
MLTIALTKGRILDETLPLLAAANIEPLEDIQSSRKLIFETSQADVRLIILRGSDVPTYVHHGAADAGIAGKDTLMEYTSDAFYEWLDLGIARCRLMTAAPVGVERKSGRIRVATKYVNVAREYYAGRGQQADVIKLYGAMELAPIMNLADEIVDIVDTGNTLKANGLEPLDTIADISSRFIVNKAAMKLKRATLTDLLTRIESALTDSARD